MVGGRADFHPGRQRKMMTAGCLLKAAAPDIGAQAVQRIRMDDLLRSTSPALLPDCRATPRAKPFNMLASVFAHMLRSVVGRPVNRHVGDCERLVLPPPGDCMSEELKLQIFARRLARRSELSEADIRDIVALPHSVRHLNANSYLIREGEPPRSVCSLVIEGMAFRHKLTAEGARQIVSLHLPGELLDLQHLFLNIADHNVQALTELAVAEIDRKALQRITLDRPAVAQALWVDGLVEAPIFREWVLNIGRRNARAKIAHILCEIVVRMRAAGLIQAPDFQLPMTQEQLGDATGLTSVHVNRTLRSLGQDGLIDHGGRWVAIKDWEGIRRIGDFNPLYLHLDQVAPAFAGSMRSIFEAERETE